MEYQANKLFRDDFGRPHGIVVVAKPEGLTSHDVVDRARRALKTKKVGHAGALDPFATGVLVLLIGRATQLSAQLMNQDKEYVADILFGIKTDSGDPEGKVQEVNAQADISGLKAVLTRFTPNYEQFVPVYSSVKVGGEKLRVLARQADSHVVEVRADGKYAVFHTADVTKEVKLPTHVCEIPELELLEVSSLQVADLQALGFKDKALEAGLAVDSTLPVAKIRLSCSKGTYVRTLAEDIGANLENATPAMLWKLQRTRVGDFNIEQAVSVGELEKL